MSFQIKAFALAVAALLVIPSAEAGSSERERSCEVNGAQRRVSFTTSEGTMMNIDVSPKGDRVVFDLLGDIYTVSMKGGRAERITQGDGWNTRPVWSPDGERIAFISDQNGQEMIYTMTPSGGDLQFVTEAREATANQSAQMEAQNKDLVIDAVEWLPGSKTLLSNGVVYSLEGSVRSRRPLDGSLEGQQLVATRAQLYSVEIRVPKTEQRQVKLGEKGIVVRALGLPSGTIAFSFNNNGALALGNAVVSDNGRWFVYAHRDAGLAALGGASDTIRVYDSLTKRTRVLVDEQRSKGWRNNAKRGFSHMERMSITPDSNYLVLSYGGLIHKIALGTGLDEVVPFEAAVLRVMPARACGRFHVDSEKVRVRSLRSASMRPDGKQVVFSALRKLFVLEDPFSGAPRPIVEADAGAFQPAYSPDGEWIAYVSWDQNDGGALYRVHSGGGSPERLSRTAGYYEAPTWSPSGSELAFLKNGDGSLERKGFETVDSNGFGELSVIDLANRRVRSLGVQARLGFPLTFSLDSSRIWYAPYIAAGGFGEPVKLISTSASGDAADIQLELAPLANSWGARTAAYSEDYGSVALVAGGNLHLAACPATLSFGLKATADECREVSLTTSGGRDARWMPGGKIEWSFADKYYQAELRAGERGRPIATTSAEDALVQMYSINMNLEVEAPRSTGMVALVGARVVSMKGEQVIENGVILVEGARIVAVGESGTLHVPLDAKRYDVTGKTVIPGLIDAHAHLTDYPRDLLAKSSKEARGYLAFGVTTVRDPSVGGDHAFEYAEMIDAGIMRGPRIFGAQGLLSNRESIHSPSDALGIARRYKGLGGTFLKIHSGWSRQQRRWIIDAAKIEGLNVASHHPVSNYFPGRLNLSTVLDGVTTLEHVLSENKDIYSDVSNFIADAGVMIDIGGLWGEIENRAAMYECLKSDPRLQSSVEGQGQVNPTAPSRELDQCKERRPSLTEHGESVARYLKQILQRADGVMIGSHGDRDGVGMHFEMWAHVAGGMSNHEVLRAATLNGARSIGVERDLGSIEPGKLADLVILEGNPLADILDSVTTSYVMKSGLLLDPLSLEEIQ